MQTASMNNAFLAELLSSSSDKGKTFKIESQNKRGFSDSFTAVEKSILNSAVIENLSNVADETNKLPNYTLILNDDPNLINSINKKLGANLQKLVNDKLEVKGKAAYSFEGSNAEDQANELHKHGIPMITYSAEAKPYITGTREAAIKAAYNQARTAGN